MAKITQLVSSRAELGAASASQLCPFLLNKTLPTPNFCLLPAPPPSRNRIFHFLLCPLLSSSKQAAQLAELALALAHPTFYRAILSISSTCSGKIEIQALPPPRVFMAPWWRVYSFHENLKVGEMGSFPTVLGSLLPDFLVLRRLFFFSLFLF